MRADIERWNEKYRAGNPYPEFEPDPILTRYRDMLDGRGRALDVACGVGHNAIYLARLGYEVTGIDGSPVGLRFCREALAHTDVEVQLVAADLDHFDPPPACFELILVVRFLSRPLVPRLQQALKPGGLFFYKTFNSNHLAARPEFARDFLLQPGELASMFADFETLATNDDATLDDSQSFFIGRKP
jgi:tellurite methyltransferase